MLFFGRYGRAGDETEIDMVKGCEGIGAWNRTEQGRTARETQREKEMEEDDNDHIQALHSISKKSTPVSQRDDPFVSRYTMHRIIRILYQP